MENQNITDTDGVFSQKERIVLKRWLKLWCVNFSAVKILLGFKVKIYPLKVVSIQDIRAL